jgi:TetR/AcrR family transcriptional repressor of nem operon
VAIAIKAARTVQECEMRVSKEKSAENREALLAAASRLFREKGVDGVGVAEVAKEAGLTHGALYAHFPSKDLLAAEAFSHGFAQRMDRARAWAGDRQPSFEEYLDSLYTTRQRDDLTTSCPMTASASDVGRQGEALSRSFAQAFEEEVSMMAGAIDETVPQDVRRQLAVASIAAQIGAIAVSRAVAKTDIGLSDEVLLATRDAIAAAFTARTAAV